MYISNQTFSGYKNEKVYRFCVILRKSFHPNGVRAFFISVISVMISLLQHNIDYVVKYQERGKVSVKKKNICENSKYYSGDFVACGKQLLRRSLLCTPELRDYAWFLQNSRIVMRISYLESAQDRFKPFFRKGYLNGDYETSVSLYSNEEIKCSVLPYEIEVYVTGVQMLRLWCQTGIAVGDCIVQKTVK